MRKQLSIKGTFPHITNAPHIFSNQYNTTLVGVLCAGHIHSHSNSPSSLFVLDFFGSLSQKSYELVKAAFLHFELEDIKKISNDSLQSCEIGLVVHRHSFP